MKFMNPVGNEKGSGFGVNLSLSRSDTARGRNRSITDLVLRRLRINHCALKRSANGETLKDS